MPLIDMSLENLHKYQGRNPRPHDMDAFWDAALQEMQAVQADIKLEPVPLKAEWAECFHLTFTGTGGSRVHAKYLRPKAHTKPHPALLMFHGYSGSSGDWHDKLGYVAKGYSVAALDCRGQGGLSDGIEPIRGTNLRGHIIRGLSDSPQNLYYRRIFLDTAQLAGIVMNMPEVDPERVGATGGSQGGALTLACAALEPRIQRLAPVYPFLCDYKRVWEMDLATGAYEELKTWFRHFDPRHEREQEVFNNLGYIDIQHLAHRIKGSTLMFTGLMDTICPPSTQFAAYNKISASKDVVIYPDFGHEGLPESGDIIFNFMADL